mmetsp:Transcript_2529/g.8995  ORF Transcript_2529/g.8995 Transcript_2529/m.8995 type:complete len:258 (-) Transcript_2529:141-914(-)
MEGERGRGPAPALQEPPPARKGNQLWHSRRRGRAGTAGVRQERVRRNPHAGRGPGVQGGADPQGVPRAQLLSLRGLHGPPCRAAGRAGGAVLAAVRARQGQAPQRGPGGAQRGRGGGHARGRKAIPEAVGGECVARPAGPQQERRPPPAARQALRRRQPRAGTQAVRRAGGDTDGQAARRRHVHAELQHALLGPRRGRRQAGHVQPPPDWLPPRGIHPRRGGRRGGRGRRPGCRRAPRGPRHVREHAASHWRHSHQV